MTLGQNALRALAEEAHRMFRSVHDPSTCPLPACTEAFAMLVMVQLAVLHPEYVMALWHDMMGYAGGMGDKAIEQQERTLRQFVEEHPLTVDLSEIN